jgi:hypothetical protein
MHVLELRATDAQNVLDGDLDDFIKAYLLEDQEQANKK